MTDEQERKVEVLKFADRLCGAGVHKVTVSYSGCGDEGRADSVDFIDSTDNLMDEERLPGDLNRKNLSELLEGFAPEGYENNEGGYGTVTFIVEAGVIRIEHNWYETISNADEPREV
jgi:hypothetical protein